MQAVPPEPAIWQTLWQLVSTLGVLFTQLSSLGLHWALWICWIAWWLWGVNWKKAWPTLAQGGWVPATLLVVLVALVWSRIAPATTGNFWYQLAYTSGLAAMAMFCGWLQGVLHWTPAEISFDPPAHGHGHGHHDHHGHGH